MENKLEYLSYDQIKEAANYVFQRTKCTAKIAIICDFGLAALAEEINGKIVVPYSLIPNFPACTDNHSGALVVGSISKIPIICCQRSFQIYDGYTMQECTMHIRMLKLLGVKFLILTNSGCGINQSYGIGDVMILKDHVNILGFSGANPLVGPNEDQFGVRFPPMSKCYDANAVELAKNILHELEFRKSIHIGVYAIVPGPNYATTAENIFLRNCGIDAVGTSMVPEAVVAKHCGMKVLALSLIANKGSTNYIDDDKEPNRRDAVKVCYDNSTMFKEFIVKFIKLFCIESLRRIEM